MFRIGSKAYSVLHFKCPHCHKGEFFVDRNPYNLSNAGDLLVNCPVCTRRYSPEPGFFYGAMYVSYALGVALFVITYVAILLLAPEAPTWVSVVMVLTVLLALTPFIYALSKIVWGNLFFTYKGVAPTPKEQAMQAARSAGSAG